MVWPTYYMESVKKPSREGRLVGEQAEICTQPKFNTHMISIEIINNISYWRINYEK